ncbi:ABC transporter permease [Nocardioides sp. WL0053]|jgi:general nucleoside transport system permease protein|uniref:ABC transporter permease n=1 Tax=Nocardioides jiangsuensis TaxID=2866161 RepID=A0ABS7RRZ2_9ACTN|nr:ABC transporter permease [Nocardioides jiangsuensis]MBY9076372.1 ABC transporter permease [Nocardioides jiangsuensis]
MKTLQRAGLALAAPVLALVVAGIITSLVLVAAGDDPAAFWETMLAWPENRSLVNIINEASVLYLSGLAAAIGFRMNLFNIGVEGQYRVATFVAAYFAAQAFLPGYLNTVATILVAMLAGAAWAGIAALLRVTRGVSEVISTIMLNAIAVSLVAYLLRKVGSREGQTIVTDTVPQSGWIPGISLFPDSVTDMYGLVFLAVLAGIGFSVLLNRTRFGFDLRATGHSESAAVASGVDVKRMVIYSMLLSGAVAGLIGMPNLFGVSHNYGSTIQTGIGFAGIAVALLGRNHPLGIAAGALIFAYLSEQANPLGILAGISPEIIAVTQGVVVLCVVIAYEVVRRYRNKLEQRAVAEALEAPGPSKEVTA